MAVRRRPRFPSRRRFGARSFRYACRFFVSSKFFERIGDRVCLSICGLVDFFTHAYTATRKPTIPAPCGGKPRQAELRQSPSPPFPISTFRTVPKLCHYRRRLDRTRPNPADPRQKVVTRSIRACSWRGDCTRDTYKDRGRPQRDSNPRYRRERAMSWAGLDDGVAENAPRRRAEYNGTNAFRNSESIRGGLRPRGFPFPCGTGRCRSP